MKLTLKQLIEREHPFDVRYSISEHMAGMKKACWLNKVLSISPAMHQLMVDAGEDQRLLTLLFDSIEVVDMGSFNVFDIGLTTSPMSPDDDIMFKPDLGGGF